MGRIKIAAYPGYPSVDKFPYGGLRDTYVYFRSVASFIFVLRHAYQLLLSSLIDIYHACW
jgi:hypothetical protein